MIFSINLLEIIPFNIINILFFFIFFGVLLLSYPTGRYILSNYSENSLIKNSIFSITVFATLVSIAANLAPILAKYVVLFFYLINFFILAINAKIRSDFYESIVAYKLIIVFTFFAFLLINYILNPIFIENSELHFNYNYHFTYQIDAVSEILLADYFSRIKILSLYPLEWSAYHFFQASFNAIFLSPVYLSGIIGLINLKYFFISIFLSLFFFSFFNKINLKKEEFLKIILKVCLIVFVFVILFFSKVLFLIQSNNFVSSISLIFIVKSIFEKKENDLLIWIIILTLSSFTNSIISFILFIYYIAHEGKFNFSNLVIKIKKALNIPNLILLTIFLLYFLSTFYQAEFTQPKYNLPVSRIWLMLTTDYLVIENYKFILISLMLLTFSYFVISNTLIKKKLFENFNKNDIFYFSLVLILPLFFTILLYFENQILETYNIEKLKIFFSSLSIKNLTPYFFVTLIWSLILYCAQPLIRFLLTIAIIIYNFLTIFLYNPLVVMPFYTLEIMILLYVLHILFNFQNKDSKKIFCYLFTTSVLICGLLNFGTYYKNSNGRNGIDPTDGSNLIFKIKELKKLSKKKYICPQDIKKDKALLNRYASALSAIVVKPYYSNVSIKDKYSNWGNISLRFAVYPKKNIKNPCGKK